MTRIAVSTIPFFLFCFSEVHSTGVDFDKKIGTAKVAALPDGQAVIYQIENNTLMILEKGLLTRNLYTGSDIDGLQVQGSDLFVLHKNGTIVQIQLQDGLILNVYKTGISSLHNFGSQHTDLCDIDQNILLLASYDPDNVYTYNISSKTKKVRVDNLNKPSSVTPGCVDGSVVYVVNDLVAHKVHVYNASWSLVKSFGEQGKGSGQLYYPHVAVMSDQGYIFVAENMNHRVSMFTSDGQFVKHIIIYDVPYYEGKENPLSLSVRGKYLWVATVYGRLTRYIF